jgi:hypothetical protein
MAADPFEKATCRHFHNERGLSQTVLQDQPTCPVSGQRSGGVRIRTNGLPWLSAEESEHYTCDMVVVLCIIWPVARLEPADGPNERVDARMLAFPLHTPTMSRECKDRRKLGATSNGKVIRQIEKPSRYGKVPVLSVCRVGCDRPGRRAAAGVTTSSKIWLLFTGW